ncbi:MAG: hypothetical protein FH749_09520 [Firmicutes bacterium]|nr:hypothetical protein [Bacillota bacterium]
MRLKALLLVVLLLLTGCTPVSRAVAWSEDALGGAWEAGYRLEFHQPDAALVYSVQETYNQDTLTIIVENADGYTQVMEFGDGFAVELGPGEIEWQQQHQGPPWYSLLVLATQIQAEKPVRDEKWLRSGDYRLSLNAGLPAAVTVPEQWSVTIESFQWK